MLIFKTKWLDLGYNKKIKGEDVIEVKEIFNFSNWNYYVFY
jgi:hypothetical protein